MVEEDLRDVLKQVTEQRSKKVISLKEDGNTFYKQGSFDKALKCYDEALVLDPNNTALLNNKGMALRRLGRTDEADECNRNRQVILSNTPDSGEISGGTPSPGVNISPVIRGTTSSSSDTNGASAPKATKNPILAAILSLIWPGLGQAYNGQYGKALLVILVELGGIALFFIPTLIAWIFSVVDAYLVSTRMVKGEIPLVKKSNAYLVVFAIVPILLIVMGAMVAAVLSGQPGFATSSLNSGQGWVYTTPTSAAYASAYYRTPTATPTPSKETLAQMKKDALIPTYTDLVTNTDNYKGKVIYFRGKVVQMTARGNNEYDLRIGTKEPDYNDNVVYVSYLDTPLVIEDEIVDVWGKVDGVAEYTSVSGTWVTIPLLTAIDIKPYTTETESQHVLLPTTYSNPSDPTMTVYRNPTYGYSVEYPQTWDKQEYYDRSSGYYLSAFSIKDKNDENLAEFRVYATLKDAQPEDIYNTMINFVSGNTAVSISSGSAAISLANNRAYRFYYTIKNQNNGLVDRKGFGICTVIKKKAYILIFEAEKDYYDDNYAKFQLMVDSFSV